MFDFDGTVVTICQGFYSRPITVRPLVSQPEMPAYAARGVYRTGPVDITSAAIADVVLSDQTTSIWIRLAEYPILPKAGDQVDIPSNLTAPAEGSFEIVDVDRHTTGKIVLTLKKLQT